MTVTVQGLGVYRADCDCPSCESFEVEGSIPALRRQCIDLGWRWGMDEGGEDACYACAGGSCGHKPYEPPEQAKEPEVEAAQDGEEGGMYVPSFGATPVNAAALGASSVSQTVVISSGFTYDQAPTAVQTSVDAVLLLIFVCAQETPEYREPEKTRMQRHKEKLRRQRDDALYRDRLLREAAELDQLFSGGTPNDSVVETTGVEVLE